MKMQPNASMTPEEVMVEVKAMLNVALERLEALIEAVGPKMAVLQGTQDKMDRDLAALRAEMHLVIDAVQAIGVALGELANSQRAIAKTRSVGKGRKA